MMRLTYKGTTYTVRTEPELLALLTWLTLRDAGDRAA
jgi:hypothetical protein